MITLHNVQGLPIAINGALIERVSGGPETHVLLVSGTSYIVTASIEDVVRLHREDRAVVQVIAERLRDVEPPMAEGAVKEASLRLVTPTTVENGGGQP
jgi:uncharacterized protein YlzI (FlbEa/FlbD family)